MAIILQTAFPDNGLVPNRQQAMIWTNDGIAHWCMYASLTLNESTIEGFKLIDI